MQAKFDRLPQTAHTTVKPHHSSVIKAASQKVFYKQQTSELRRVLTENQRRALPVSVTCNFMYSLVETYIQVLVLKVLTV